MQGSTKEWLNYFIKFIIITNFLSSVFGILIHCVSSLNFMQDLVNILHNGFDTLGFRFCLPICSILTCCLYSYKHLLINWSWVRNLLTTMPPFLCHAWHEYQLLITRILCFRVATWLRVSVWMLIGVLVYLFYGRTHSSLLHAIYVPSAYADEIHRSQASHLA